MTTTNPHQNPENKPHADLHDLHATGPSRTHTPLKGVGVRSTHTTHRPNCPQPTPTTSTNHAIPGVTITRCPECGATTITRNQP